MQAPLYPRAESARVPTVVFFCCEADCPIGKATNLYEVECTLASAVVASADAFHGDASAANRSVTCWRDVSDGEGPFEPLFKAFDAAEAVVAYNAFGYCFPLLAKYYGRAQASKDRLMRHRLKCLDPVSIKPTHTRESQTM